MRDVLPSLGEEDVPAANMEDLYAERATRRDPQPELSRLEGDLRMVAAVERAVAFFQDLPQEIVVAELADRGVVVRPAHWREALATCEQTQHVPRRAELLTSLGELLSAPEVARDPAVVRALRAGWPDLSPADLVTDLLTHRALLAHCAPWLTQEQRANLRADALAHGRWHVSDLPLLDVARQRLGLDPVDEVPAAELARRRAAAEAAVADLIVAADEDSALHLLRGNARTAPTDRPGRPPTCWSRPARLPPPGPVSAPSVTSSSTRHRTSPPSSGRSCSGVARTARSPSSATVRSPDLRSPRAGRSGWRHGTAADPRAAPVHQLPPARRPHGAGSRSDPGRPARRPGAGGDPHRAAAGARARGVAFYAPEDLQGLEMDVVVIVEPAELFGDDDAAAPSLYVTLTRATQAVVVLHQRELPACAADGRSLADCSRLTLAGPAARALRPGSVRGCHRMCGPGELLVHSPVRRSVSVGGRF